VFVQSFEAANLRRLRVSHNLRARMVFLTASVGAPFNDPTPYAEYLTPAGLREVRRFADGVGPEKGQVIARHADGALGTPTTLVADAHAAGLVVHPYTFRAENQFLPTDLRTGA
jgi:glycerophosphoryl diester phosphodiesterase